MILIVWEGLAMKVITVPVITEGLGIGGQTVAIEKYHWKEKISIFWNNIWEECHNEYAKCLNGLQNKNKLQETSKRAKYIATKKKMY